MQNKSIWNKLLIVTYDVYHQYLIPTVILEHIFVIKWLRLYPKWKGHWLCGNWNILNYFKVICKKKEKRKKQESA